MEKRVTILILVLFSLILSGNFVSATTISYIIGDGHIDDLYAGGSAGSSDPATHSPSSGEDNVIGGFDYEVYGMDVSISDNVMTVAVETNFNQENSFYSYGDLFLSVNGWNPYGSAPYNNNNHYNGEVWEYAFDVDSGNMYDIREAQDRIIMGAVQAGQEVAIDPVGLEALSTSGTAVRDEDLNAYVMSFSLAGLELAAGFWELGFHWSMTCGNDPIEGSIVGATVPEPSTMLLLGSGLLGAVVRGRKKLLKK